MNRERTETETAAMELAFSLAGALDALRVAKSKIHLSDYDLRATIERIDTVLARHWTIATSTPTSKE